MKILALFLGTLFVLFGSPFVVEAASISSLTPEDNSIGLSIQPLFFRVVFDDTVSRGTGNITLYKTSDDSVVETWDVTGEEATFSPSQVVVFPTVNLEPNTEYYILIDASAIGGFVGIADKTTWSFTTDAYDTPRGISSLSPEDDAIDIPVLPASLSINFDGFIYTGTGNITLYRTSDDSVVETWDVTDGGRVSAESQSVSFSPSNPLEFETSYYVTIDATAVVPFAGITDSTTWNFTTAPAPTFDFERVSVSGEGTEGDGASIAPSLSSDGRYVVFESDATNLVPDDTNAVTDVFLYDRALDTIQRISVDADGIEGDDESTNPYISSDGRYIVFVSRATNLAPDIVSIGADIFLYDRELDTIEQINEPGAGNQSFNYPSVSDDGRYVAFAKNTSAFFSKEDVFVYDRELDTTTNISSAGSNEFSTDPTISRDGLYVVFDSTEADLIGDDTNGVQDVFVYNMTTTEITRVSVDGEGTEGNADSFAQSISSDGRYVAFISSATNLTDDVVSGSGAVFVHDRTLGITELIGISYIEVDQTPEAPVMLSADGRYVVYAAYAEGGSDIHIYRYDREEDIELLITEGVGGADGYVSAHDSTISGEGTTVAFSSENTDLVVNDTNSIDDVFVVDLDEEEPEEDNNNDEGGRGGSSGSHRHFTNGSSSTGDDEALKIVLMKQIIALLKQLLEMYLAGGTF